MFESRPVRAVQHYVINFVSDVRQVSGILRVLQFPPPLKLTEPRYSWNIVESGVKHHNKICLGYSISYNWWVVIFML